MGNRAERESYDADEIYAHVGLRTPKAYRAVEKILKCNPELTNKLHEGKTLLDEPCIRGNAKMVSLLLDLGVFVHLPNKYGRSPVMTATCYGNYQVVKVLCQRGAIIDNVYIKQTMSLFDLAIYRGYYEIAAYLYTKVTSKKIQQPSYYDQLAKKYNSRYVNYELFIEGLKTGKNIQEMPDFLTKKKDQSQPIKVNNYFCCCDIFKTRKERSLQEEVNNYRQSLKFELILNSETHIEYRSSKSSEVDTVNAVDNFQVTDRETDRHLSTTYKYSISQQAK